MLQKNANPRSKFRSGLRVYISLLFLGFFPGALLMFANQKEESKPFVLEYDLMILRVPAAADLSKIPDFEDWNDPAIRRPLYEQGWRILHQPKLMSAYPCEISTYLGPIPGLDGKPGNGPEYDIRFLTHLSGDRLQTYMQFGSADAFQTHRFTHLPGKTQIQPLSPIRPERPYRYFLLLKVTSLNQVQAAALQGIPTVAPASAAPAPSKSKTEFFKN